MMTIDEMKSWLRHVSGHAVMDHHAREGAHHRAMHSRKKTRAFLDRTIADFSVAAVHETEPGVKAIMELRVEAAKDLLSGLGRD